MNTEFDMREIRFHQYRMQIIEKWPESSEKHAALSAARAVLVREVAYETEKCVSALEPRFSSVPSNGTVFAECAID